MSKKEMAVSSEEIPFSDQMIKVPGGNVWTRIYGSGSKTPIIVLHGGPGSPSDYLWSLQKLAVDRQVVIYDQLGCGQSDRGKASDYHLDRFVEELNTIITFLNFEKSILIGHSWGSMLAVESALRFTNRFSAMILLSPCLSLARTQKDMNRLRAALPNSVQNTLSRLEENNQTDSLEYQFAALAFYQRHLCRIKPWPKLLEVSPKTWGIEVYNKMWGPVEFLPIGSLKSYERAQDIATLNMPILFMCGRYDEITPEATTSYYNKAKKGQLHIFENSSHVAHLEEPEEFFKVVKKYLVSLELLHK
jgi:proline iminopeptidase